jgi:hypothetical protein
MSKQFYAIYDRIAERYTFLFESENDATASRLFQKEHTGRPHYHMILFGYEPEKLEPYRKVKNDGYMIDSRITKCWGMGLHNLINPTQGGYSYVSGYVVKKFDDETKEHIKNGLRPPFAQMSRDPGLGMKYYQEHKEEIWKNGFIQLDNGKRVSIPRYFQEMQKQEDPRIVWPSCMFSVFSRHEIA